MSQTNGQAGSMTFKNGEVENVNLAVSEVYREEYQEVPQSFLTYQSTGQDLPKLQGNIVFEGTKIKDSNLLSKRVVHRNIKCQPQSNSGAQKSQQQINTQARNVEAVQAENDLAPPQGQRSENNRSLRQEDATNQHHTAPAGRTFNQEDDEMDLT